MTDGNLRQIFKKYLPDADWTPVETWSTGRGVPDVNYCFKGGYEGWIENKATKGWKVVIRPEQIAWIERRVRFGGSVFVAVRRQAKGADQLWLAHGACVRELALVGLMKCLINCQPIGIYGETGPKSWDWRAVELLLKKK